MWNWRWISATQIFFSPPICRCGCLWCCCKRRNTNANSSEVESQENSTIIDQQVTNVSDISNAKDEIAGSYISTRELCWVSNTSVVLVLALQCHSFSFIFMQQWFWNKTNRNWLLMLWSPHSFFLKWTTISVQWHPVSVLSHSTYTSLCNGGYKLLIEFAIIHGKNDCVSTCFFCYISKDKGYINSNNGAWSKIYIKFPSLSDVQ